MLTNQVFVKVVRDYFSYHHEIINYTFNLETLEFFQTSFGFNKFQLNSFILVYDTLIIFCKVICSINLFVFEFDFMKHLISFIFFTFDDIRICQVPPNISTFYFFLNFSSTFYFICHQLYQMLHQPVIYYNQGDFLNIFHFSLTSLFFSLLYFHIYLYLAIFISFLSYFQFDFHLSHSL